MLAKKEAGELLLQRARPCKDFSSAPSAPIPQQPCRLADTNGMHHHLFYPRLDAYHYDWDEDRFVMWVTLGQPSIGAELCVHGFLHGAVFYSWAIRGQRGPTLPLPQA